MSEDERINTHLDFMLSVIVDAQRRGNDPIKAAKRAIVLVRESKRWDVSNPTLNAELLLLSDELKDPKWLRSYESKEQKAELRADMEDFWERATHVIRRVIELSDTPSLVLLAMAEREEHGGEAPELRASTTGVASLHGSELRAETAAHVYAEGARAETTADAYEAERRVTSRSIAGDLEEE